ncbi:SusC/RagA family TonB-linked outer membrane protein [Chitinophaga sp. Cy-1792]|uniref:SusC/RagA family TonB-linked outer membrane protein n=1 Tax=Chitinophaga sp. Cy-1792 TaxID=2608339 RepID=UPI001420A86C|nr:SusC/RagA family TonB-linked outer membrane protein [Chitinophaga sp. Cy-1792]NIG56956.1 SusC/RagA family TonB-linked outer membrane protein [Chitinophaga sp. Cy-1792]
MNSVLKFIQTVAMACLLVAASQHSSAQVRNMPVTTALKQVTKSFGTSFVYENSLLEDINVSFDPASISGKSVEAVLKEMLYPKGLIFLFVNDNTYTIIRDVRKKNPVPGNTTGTIDQKALSGIVTDENNRPLPGVTVKNLRNKEGTLTDANGYYTLKTANAGDMLVFTFVGYKTQQQIVTKAAQLNISMSTDNIQLSTVEVSTGYQTIAKERATGSFSQIKDLDLEKKVTMNVADKMEGLVSGLLVTTNPADASGRPTTKTTLTIRGRNTLRAQQDPLIVIDGFPYEGDLSMLNPEDISRVTFLKDAAAASIWGVRAANGVVVIEMKKGKNQKRLINFSTNYTIGGKPDLSYRPVANSADYLDFEQEAVNKSLLPDPSGKTLPSTSAGADIFFRYKRGEITAAQRDALVAQLASYDYKSSYSKYLLQQQQIKQYNLSVAGGNDAAKYFISGSYSDELPVAKGNRNQRVTLNSTNIFQLTKNLEANVGFMIVMANTKNNGVGLKPLEPGTGTLLPYDRIVDENGAPMQYSRAFNKRTLDSLEKMGYLPWKYNYIDELANADNTSRSNLYRLNGGFHYKIIPGLSASLSGLYERSFARTRNYYSPSTYTSRNTVNNATSVQAGKLVYGLPRGGILDLSNVEMEHYDVRGQLNYSKSLGANHRIDAVGGGEIRQVWTNGATSRLYGYDDQTLSSSLVNYDLYYKTAVTNYQNKPSNPNTLSDARDRYLSWYTNANYTYHEKYVLSGSVRLDDSNLFGASKKYRATPLWSMGAMWKLGEENFMNTAVMNRLNLRATYGVNGNVDKTTSPYLIATVPSSIGYYNGLPYADISNPANPLLRWEKTKTFNVGVDASFWKSKLEMSLDVYYKRCYDLLGPAEFNPTYGFTSLTVNTAKVDNHGADLNITADFFREKAFSWKSIMNFSYNMNKVASSNLQRELVTYYVNSGSGSNPVKGKPIEAVYSYRFGGLDSAGRPTLLNGAGKRMLTEADIASDLTTLTYSGSTVPKYFGGWTNTFRYKQLELSALVTFKFDYVFRRPSVSYFSYSTQKSINKDVALRWKQPGDENKTIVPVMPSTGVNYSESWYLLSDQLIESGSHIRLREVSLSYDLPAQLLRSIHLQKLSLLAYGRNLALWTQNKAGIDPDYIPSAYYTMLPPARSFAIGLRTTF